MHQLGLKVLIMKHREGETNLLGIEELSKILLHHGHCEHVVAGMSLEIQQNGFSQQGIRSPEQPVD
jgi:hypothetical protein